MDKMKFNAYGHRNITATHKTTIEFTKDSYLTRKGDCILGINSDFSAAKLNMNKIRVRIRSGQITDELFCYYNKGFGSDHSMVIRKSDYTDLRTFGIKSNKAAIDIDRKIIIKQREPRSMISVEVKPVRIKAVIFDFDDTIEEFSPAQEYAEEKLADHLAEHMGIGRSAFRRVFRKVRARYESTAIRPAEFGRDLWLKDTFRLLNIRASMEQIKSLEKIYWDFCNKKIRLFPGVREMLGRIRLKKALLSDADGDKQIKAERIRLLGVDKLFKTIVTSNDTGYNKPHISNFLRVAERLQVRPEECIMIGNRPKSDLINAKKLGMSTVLVRTGNWYQRVGYADFEIEAAKDFEKIINNFLI